MQDYDVIVVGAGNAALAAAVSAHENGAKRVIVLEKAPRDMRGGNTHWAGAGSLRAARWSAGYSTTPIRLAPVSCRAQHSHASPAAMPLDWRRPDPRPGKRWR